MDRVKSKIADIELRHLNVFSRESGTLSSLELEKEVPWSVQRVFFINSVQEQDRGDHAHKECIQAIVCLSGEVEIYCYDGEEEVIFHLSNLGQLLVVPPGIWLKLKFQAESSITVLASQEFFESDYIRSMEEYKRYRLSK